MEEYLLSLTSFVSNINSIFATGVKRGVMQFLVPG
jgi:hypothetical protein